MTAILYQFLFLLSFDAFRVHVISLVAHISAFNPVLLVSSTEYSRRILVARYG